jgi:predicted small metal-binding protein
MSELKMARCGCGWQIIGTVEEVVPAVIEHGEKLHNMPATPEQVLARLEAAPSAQTPPSPRLD